MERLNINEECAFECLIRESRARNIKLREIAESTASNPSATPTSNPVVVTSGRLLA